MPQQRKGCFTHRPMAVAGTNATKMKNRFFEKPTEDDIKEMGERFGLLDAVIALDGTDVKAVMGNAGNSVVLTGKATGRNRLADAIEDAVLHACSVAEGYELFSADKVLLYIASPKSEPMLMSECEALSTFREMFPQAAEWRWGLAEKSDIRDMRIVIIASNVRNIRPSVQQSK